MPLFPPRLPLRVSPRSTTTALSTLTVIASPEVGASAAWYAGGEMMEIDLLTVKGPYPAEESTMTSPPSLVLEMATSKVRQGSGTVQLALSRPLSDTALRLFRASTVVEKRMARMITTPILGIEPPSFAIKPAAVVMLGAVQAISYSNPLRTTN